MEDTLNTLAEGVEIFVDGDLAGFGERIKENVAFLTTGNSELAVNYHLTVGCLPRLGFEVLVISKDLYSSDFVEDLAYTVSEYGNSHLPEELTVKGNQIKITTVGLDTTRRILTTPVADHFKDRTGFEPVILQLTIDPSNVPADGQLPEDTQHRDLYPPILTTTPERIARLLERSPNGIIFYGANYVYDNKGLWDVGIMRTMGLTQQGKRELFVFWPPTETNVRHYVELFKRMLPEYLCCATKPNEPFDFYTESEDGREFVQETVVLVPLAPHIGIKRVYRNYLESVGVDVEPRGFFVQDQYACLKRARSKDGMRYFIKGKKP